MDEERSFTSVWTKADVGSRLNKLEIYPHPRASVSPALDFAAKAGFTDEHHRSLGIHGSSSMPWNTLVFKIPATKR
jgi:hypothetical protein